MLHCFTTTELPSCCQLAIAKVLPAQQTQTVQGSSAQDSIDEVFGTAGFHDPDQSCRVPATTQRFRRFSGALPKSALGL